ncbi:MAG: hypothetical protein LBP59_03130 [Planctomycetaceae bacterium]|nr:hypothetical protein [Planctomycetaceae bacterium]
MREVLLSTALSVALRQHAGETPAIRWSRLLFKIAGRMPAIRWSVICFKNDPQITQIRKIFLGTSGTIFVTINLSHTPYPLSSTPNPYTLPLTPKNLTLTIFMNDYIFNKTLLKIPPSLD